MPKPISPEEKIAITLRFLATGETFYGLMYQFRVYNVTIDESVLEVYKAIYHCSKDEGNLYQMTFSKRLRRELMENVLLYFTNVAVDPSFTTVNDFIVSFF